MDGSTLAWLSRSLGFGLSAQEAKPYYLTDRLLACIYGTPDPP